MRTQSAAGPPAFIVPVAEVPVAPAEVQTSASSVSGRLLPLDALRGFDMFWIIGADESVHALDKINAQSAARGGSGHARGLVGLLSTQLQHVDWVGFHFYDMIFPLFVFLTGVALVFSLDKTVEQEGKARA